MSLEHRRYLRQEKSKEDKQQSILCVSGIAPNPHHFAVKADLEIPYDKKVTCPFCLALGELNKFLTSTKKGISRSHVKCPFCHQGFLMRTLLLMTKWSAKEYAEWAQPYSHSGFWQKVNFDVWKDRLRIIGWTEEFWNRYKELKTNDSHENYADHMDRESEEWARRQQQIEEEQRA